VGQLLQRRQQIRALRRRARQRQLQRFGTPLPALNGAFVRRFESAKSG
jgi:hypothetical protein